MLHRSRAFSHSLIARAPFSNNDRRAKQGFVLWLNRYAVCSDVRVQRSACACAQYDLVEEHGEK
jgi:hypothetical protein